jgi:hypothetical protein
MIFTFGHDASFQITSRSLWIIIRSFDAVYTELLTASSNELQTGLSPRANYTDRDTAACQQS